MLLSAVATFIHVLAVATFIHVLKKIFFFYLFLFEKSNSRIILRLKTFFLFDFCFIEKYFGLRKNFLNSR